MLQREFDIILERKRVDKRSKKEYNIQAVERGAIGAQSPKIWGCNGFDGGSEA